jgi:hypothetical protein
MHNFRYFIYDNVKQIKNGYTHINKKNIMVKRLMTYIQESLPKVIII